MTARTKSQARSQATDIVNQWAAGVLLTGWIPGMGLLSGAADQVMIRQVGDCYGVGVLDMDTLVAHIGGIVGSSVGGAAAAELLSFVPVVGWAVKSATLAGKSKLIGEAVIDYFEELSPLPE